MRMVICEVEDWEREAFRGLGAEHQLEFTREKLHAGNAGEYIRAEVLSVFIYSDLSARVLQEFPDLKLVATRSTGFDHIDIDYCREKGISVCNVPAYGENTVAEHVFGLLLAISHHLVEAVDRTRRGDFSLKGLQGFDLRGKTLGVVGTGAIGECVIEIARGFRMEVLAFDINPREDLAARLGFRYVSMDELLARSDVVTLHVPASAKTRNLISDAEFARMKEGVVLINTARGSVVDVRALVGAIGEGKVKAAGLDVLPGEPVLREEAELLRTAFWKEHDLSTLLADHVLLRLRNVIITPHSAFNTREAVQRILDTTAENIVSFARGEPQNALVQPQPATAHL